MRVFLTGSSFLCGDCSAPIDFNTHSVNGGVLTQDHHFPEVWTVSCGNKNCKNYGKKFSLKIPSMNAKEIP